MRGEDDVVEAAQHRLERVALRLRLDREDVEGGAGDVAGQQVVAQRLVVDDHAPRRVDEERPRLHGRELRGAEEPGVAGPSVDVQAHDVGDLEQLRERPGTTRVPMRRPVRLVVEHDAHPERLGDVRQLRADVAVAHDAQGPAAHLVAAARRLVPHAVVHPLRLLRQPAGERDDLADHELDHTARVGVRRVEHPDAPCRRGAQVDLVGADAEAADRLEVRCRFQDPRGHGGVGADAEQTDTGQGLDQLVLGQRARAQVHLVAAAAEDLGGRRVDVLQDESLHAITVGVEGSLMLTWAARVGGARGQGARRRTPADRDVPTRRRLRRSPVGRARVCRRRRGRPAARHPVSAGRHGGCRA